MFALMVCFMIVLVGLKLDLLGFGVLFLLDLFC